MRTGIHRRLGQELGRRLWPGRGAEKPRSAEARAREQHDSLRAASTASEAALLERFQGGPDGLADDVAAGRLAETGPNLVAQERPPSWYGQLLHAFRNPFVLLLLVLAAVSFASRDFAATAIIAVMVLVGVLLRFSQERRSVVAAGRLRAMVKITATVLRRDAAGLSRTLEVPLEALVPGDVVRLSAGDMVPADARVLAGKDLFVSQAALNGEALPLEKFPGQAPAASRAPLEAPNLLFLGTSVVSGSASALVVATGPRTLFGAIARSVAGARAPTAFDRGVRRVSVLLIWISASMASLVFLINGLGKGDWSQAFLFALAVAVGLTPEMLPAVVAGALAVGSVQMSRKKVVVKRLEAIQNVGAMDVLCTDKTGTLTRGEVVLIRCCDLAGREDEGVFRYGWLNSRHQTGLKNLLDRAILGHHTPDAAGVRKVDEIPFDFSRRVMSVVVDAGGRRQLIAKGAPAEVLARCTRFELDGEILDIERLLLDELRQGIDRLGAEGFRVVALATRDVDPAQATFSREDERDLVLRGTLAFLDPPRESAAEAIAALLASGVQVKILTGDNEIVTRKVCTVVGLPPGRIVLGAELEGLSAQALGERAEQATVLARLTPVQKEQVITALRARGHVVGFLGDGINDAAALRAADVGISVDTAVDIARDSADVILLEKSLLVLAEGVREGRRVFGNILKYIRMGLSSNFGNIFSVVGASILLPFLPMLPLQLLVQNLLYDLSQLAIPFDHVDDEYLRRPHPWHVGHLARFTFLFGPVSSVFDYTTFALLWFVFGANSVQSQHLFQSGWFVEGLLSQTLVVHLIRTRKIPFLQSRAAPALLLSTLAVMAAGLALPFSPLAPALRLVPLPGAFFPWLGLTLLAYLALAQAVKGWFQRRIGFYEPRKR